MLWKINEKCELITGGALQRANYLFMKTFIETTKPAR